MERRRLAPLLALVVLVVGCTGGPTPLPPDSSKPLSIDEANDPKFEQGAGGFLIVWNFSLAWRPAQASGQINVTFDVRAYGRQPAGSGAQDARFEGNEKKFMTFRTQFLGIGDYRYSVEAHATNGTLVGERTGVFETCVC